MQFTERYNGYPTRQLWPSVLETACHATPSCHLIFWLKLLSLAIIRHCICMQHLLTCSLMPISFHLHYLLPTFWDWWHQSIHILLTVLEPFLLHRNSSFIQWQTNVNGSHISLQYTVEHNEEAQAPNMCTYKIILISISYYRFCSTQQYMALICITMSMTV
jgi:hypothetical protein